MEEINLPEKKRKIRSSIICTVGNPNYFVAGKRLL